MKNKSWQHPFPTFEDKHFDRNKDGKLDAFETIFRDMHINEMNRKADNYSNKRSVNGTYKSKNYSKFTPETKSDKSKSTENNVSAGLQLFVIFLVIAILIGGFMIAVTLDGNAFIRVVILFVTVAISLWLLKKVELYK